MTLNDREYQRAHRNDPEGPEPPSESSKLWIWILVILVIGAVLHFWKPIP